MMTVGWVGLAQFPDLDSRGSEQITILMLQDIGLRVPAMSIMIILFLSAAVAAIMSTVDSALLAISSMVTIDLYSHFKPNKKQSDLTKFGKIFSWIIMALAVLLAIELPQTIWRLMEIKLELLCQISPSIFLGIHYNNLQSKSVLAGVIVGTFIALLIIFTCLLYTSPSPRDLSTSRMPSSA